MKELLRKLAAQLRKQASDNARKRVHTCAKVAQAALALELLRKKIGG